MLLNRRGDGGDMRAESHITSALEPHLALAEDEIANFQAHERADNTDQRLTVRILYIHGRC